MNKFDRVISTLILLQSRRRIKAVVISERFGTSLRTVYRDISTLKNAGIPIIGDPGIGYSIMEGYSLPPVMFNEREAAALLTGEKFIGKITDKETQAFYSDAMVKIKAILRNSEKKSLEALEGSIAISSNNNWADRTYLQDLFKSISARLLVEINYEKPDGSTSERRIEPIGCYHQFNMWYLVAYCQLKKDYRIFKMDRISQLQVLDIHFDAIHISLQKYIDQQDESWKAKQKFLTMEIAFNQSVVKFAESRKYYFGFIEQKIVGDTVHMKFLNSSIEIVARWVLQFADQATVIAPEQLKDRLKTLAHHLYEHYT